MVGTTVRRHKRVTEIDLSVLGSFGILRGACSGGYRSSFIPSQKGLRKSFDRYLPNQLIDCTG